MKVHSLVECFALVSSSLAFGIDLDLSPSADATWTSNFFDASHARQPDRPARFAGFAGGSGQSGERRFL